MKDSIHNSFCILPWISQHVATTGKIAPCCEYDGNLGNLSDTTLSDAWHGDDIREIKRQFLAGEEVAGCWKCFDRDKNEGTSFRQEINALFPDWVDTIRQSADRLHAGPESPITIDLRFSNLCNFKCRSCWHGSSSKWFSDSQAMGNSAGDKAEIRSFESVDDVTQQIKPYLNALEDIYFAGGEPLMTAEHYNVLNLLIAHQRTDLRLRYTTNMSRIQFNGQSIFDLWKKFGNVEVEASIDAPGTRGEVIRKGLDWEVFVNHIAELREQCPHVKITFGTTVSALNVLAIPDLFDALQERCDATPADIHLHSLQEPVFYRTQILPRSAKRSAIKLFSRYVGQLEDRGEVSLDHLQAITEKLEVIKTYMMAQNLQHCIPRFQLNAKKLDELRLENSGDVFPELHAVWNYKPPLWEKGLRRVRTKLSRVLERTSWPVDKVEKNAP